MLDKIDKQIIIEISKDIEISRNPYRDIAKKVNISMEDFLTRLKGIMDKGYIKRIVPLIKHHNTEYTFNALTVWKVEDNEKEKLAEMMKEIESISHVYERQIDKEWNYNIYGMIHGKSKEEVKKIIDSILKCIKVEDYKVLYTKKELKKTSPNIEHLLG